MSQRGSPPHSPNNKSRVSNFQDEETEGEEDESCPNPLEEIQRQAEEELRSSERVLNAADNYIAESRGAMSQRSSRGQPDYSIVSQFNEQNSCERRMEMNQHDTMSHRFARSLSRSHCDDYMNDFGPVAGNEQLYRHASYRQPRSPGRGNYDMETTNESYMSEGRNTDQSSRTASYRHSRSPAKSQYDVEPTDESCAFDGRSAEQTSRMSSHRQPRSPGKSQYDMNATDESCALEGRTTEQSSRMQSYRQSRSPGRSTYDVEATEESFALQGRSTEQSPRMQSSRQSRSPGRSPYDMDATEESCVLEGRAAEQSSRTPSHRPSRSPGKSQYDMDEADESCALEGRQDRSSPSSGRSGGRSRRTSFAQDTYLIEVPTDPDIYIDPSSPSSRIASFAPSHASSVRPPSQRSAQPDSYSSSSRSHASRGVSLLAPPTLSYTETTDSGFRESDFIPSSNLDSSEYARLPMSRGASNVNRGFSYGYCDASSTLSPDYSRVVSESSEEPDITQIPACSPSNATRMRNVLSNINSGSFNAPVPSPSDPPCDSPDSPVQEDENDVTITSSRGAPENKCKRSERIKEFCNHSATCSSAIGDLMPPCGYRPRQRNIAQECANATTSMSFGDATLVNPSTTPEDYASFFENLDKRKTSSPIQQQQQHHHHHHHDHHHNHSDEYDPDKTIMNEPSMNETVISALGHLSQIKSTSSYYSCVPNQVLDFLKVCETKPKESARPKGRVSKLPDIPCMAEEDIDDLLNCEAKDVESVRHLSTAGRALYKKPCPKQQKAQMTVKSMMEAHNMKESCAPKYPPLEHPDPDDLSPGLAAAMMFSQEDGAKLDECPNETINRLFPDEPRPPFPEKSHQNSISVVDPDQDQEEMVEKSISVPADGASDSVYAKTMRDKGEDLGPMKSYDVDFAIGQSKREYVLVPQKPQRINRVQFRGGNSPSWFPGYFSAFPNDVTGLSVVASPSTLFQKAWLHTNPANIPASDVIVID